MFLLGQKGKMGTIARCSTEKGLTTTVFKPFNKKEKEAWLETCSERGFIRLYDPYACLKRSVVVPCTLQTSAAEIAGKLGLLPTDLHMQMGGDELLRLGQDEKPLKIQNEYLKVMGIADLRKQQELGDVLSLGYLIRFFAG